MIWCIKTYIIAYVKNTKKIKIMIVFRTVYYHQLMLNHGCILSTVATDAMVPRHQATSIHSADQSAIILNPLPYRNIFFSQNDIRKWNYILKKYTDVHVCICYTTKLIYPVPCFMNVFCQLIIADW